jgi:hypothetical protein
MKSSNAGFVHLDPAKTKKVSQCEGTMQIQETLTADSSQAVPPLRTENWLLTTDY